MKKLKALAVMGLAGVLAASMAATAFAADDFNAAAYSARYSDLAVFGGNADLLRQHYNVFGKAEGRIASAGVSAATPTVTSAAATSGFDAVYYAGKYPDLAVFGGDASLLYQHWITFGKAEGRIGCAPKVTAEDPYARFKTSSSGGGSSHSSGSSSSGSSSSGSKQSSKKGNHHGYYDPSKEKEPYRVKVTGIKLSADTPSVLAVNETVTFTVSLSGTNTHALHPLYVNALDKENDILDGEGFQMALDKSEIGVSGTKGDNTFTWTPTVPGIYSICVTNVSHSAGGGLSANTLTSKSNSLLFEVKDDEKEISKITLDPDSELPKVWVGIMDSDLEKACEDLTFAVEYKDDKYPEAKGVKARDLGLSNPSLSCDLYYNLCLSLDFTGSAKYPLTDTMTVSDIPFDLIKLKVLAAEYTDKDALEGDGVLGEPVSTAPIVHWEDATQLVNQLTAKVTIDKTIVLSTGFPFADTGSSGTNVLTTVPWTITMAHPAGVDFSEAFEMTPLTIMDVAPFVEWPSSVKLEHLVVTSDSKNSKIMTVPAYKRNYGKRQRLSQDYDGLSHDSHGYSPAAQ